MSGLISIVLCLVLGVFASARWVFAVLESKNYQRELEDYDQLWNETHGADED